MEKKTYVHLWYWPHCRNPAHIVDICTGISLSSWGYLIVIVFIQAVVSMLKQLSDNLGNNDKYIYLEILFKTLMPYIRTLARRNGYPTYYKLISFIMFPVSRLSWRIGLGCIETRSLTLLSVLNASFFTYNICKRYICTLVLVISFSESIWRCKKKTVRVKINKDKYTY